MILKIGPVIKAERGHNRYCGPAALSIITGCDTATAALILRHVSGCRSITGVSAHHMLKAFKHLGYPFAAGMKLKATPEGKIPTFARWLETTREERGERVFLVAAGNHWVVVQGDRAACSLTEQVVHVSQTKKRRAPMAILFEILPRPADVAPPPVLVTRAQAVDKVRAPAKALEKKKG
jgi:hypothetical protein